MIHLKLEELHVVISPWPFVVWGMDILGPFSLGNRQVKFLLIAINYFTKSIEAKPLTTITTHQVQKFVWKNKVYRFYVA